MLQALRSCINGAGAKMTEKTRKELSSTFESYLSAPEDATRTTAAASLGCLCKHLTDEELSLIMNLHFLG